MTNQKSNKRILITKPYLETGGVHSFVNNVISFFTNPVFVFKRGKNPKIKFKVFTILHTLFTPYRLFLSIIRQNPNYIIVNSSLSKGNLIRDGLLIFISKICRKKVLLIIHGFQETALKHRTLLNWGYFKADAIIVLAQIFADLINKTGYKREIFVQFNPVSVDIINGVSEKTNKLVKNKNVEILFLSRVEQAKGIFTTLNAFSEVVKNYPETSLKIGGKGAALEAAKKMVLEKNIKNVDFLGYVKGAEKTKLLNSSDIFLFPTEHKEGLPINTLEAMTAGQIVITRPVAGLKDLYEKHNFGYAIEFTDPSVYANAIKEIIENPERFKQTSVRNAKFARENFHPQIITRKIESILSAI